MSRRLKVLLLAPYYDRQAAGESWSTYQWVKGVSEQCDVTVLTMHQRGWKEEHSPTDALEVIDWPDFKVPRIFQRLSWELKPGYVRFFRRARSWIRERLQTGWDFDLVHQINPLALRYPCPAIGLGVKYIIGPLAGSLQTPSGFSKEGTDRQWFRKLRKFDSWRLKHDTWLKRSYSEAAAVCIVAPYVKELLSHLSVKRFEIMSETGIEQVMPPQRDQSSATGPLRLLFVGRVIRTKGVVDAIRAVALLPKDVKVTFDIIGVGDSLDCCREEVKLLGIEDCVRFHGRLPREEVNEWYRRSEVFLFPSFREPSGNVVMEALSYGLPVLTSQLGGPGYVVTDRCGVRVPAVNPDEYAKVLAQNIEKMARDRKLVTQMSVAAIERVSDLALWPQKINCLVKLYRELGQDHPYELASR